VTTPYLSIDLDKIAHNARVIVDLCRRHGIQVSGVTKAVCGMPEVARAMLRGGVAGIADSRAENIHRLKAGGVATELMLLRIPPLSAAYDTVLTVDVSLNSELPVLKALSQAAQRLGRQHGVILMVDLGDLREGVWPDQLPSLMTETLKLPGIRVTGLGANLACLSGVAPSIDAMQRLVDLSESVEKDHHLRLERLSGINSSGLRLIAEGGMPARINHARIGEAILLGRETVHRDPWPDTYQDAFTLQAEVLELQDKPSRPVGERGEDAFGGQPGFEDKGIQHRALLNLGRTDADISGLTPLDGRLQILGASSGYLVLDASAAKGTLKVGDEIAFAVGYRALATAMASDYVHKRTLGGVATA
jgi:predicted amino acid racemase